MGRIFIHAGIHKTGSSSIQLSLSRGIDNNEYFYFDLGEPNHSGPLVNLFSTDPQNYHGNRKRGRTIAQLLELRQSLDQSFLSQLESLGARNGILSAEDLCNFQEKELQCLRDTISKYGHEILIIVYVRGIYDYIDSAFQQLIKGGGLSRFSVSAAAPNYMKLERLIKIFDKELISFCYFARDDLHGNDVVSDFVYRIGLRRSSIEIVETNEGISLRALKFLYIFRQYGPQFEKNSLWIKRNNTIVSRLARLKGPKLKLSPNLTKQVVESELNALHSSSHFLSFAALLKRIAHDTRTSFNVASEADLLNLLPDDINDFISLCNELSVECSSSLSYYQDPARVAHAVFQLIPTRLRVDTVDTQIIRGSDNYLFLGRESHGLNLNYRNNIRDINNSTRIFSVNIARRARLMRQLDIAYKHIILPHKCRICVDFLPDSFVPYSTNLDIANVISSHEFSNSFVYPLEPLSADVLANCLRVDTHLSLIGTAVCLKAIVDSLHNDGFRFLAEPYLDIIQRVKEACVIGHRIQGDLGVKLNPPEFEDTYILPKSPNIVYYTNEATVNSRGICDLYFNREFISSGPRIAIFGDTSGRQLASVLAHFVGQVYFFFTPFMHNEIVNAAKPDVVLTQNVESDILNVVSDNARSTFLLYPILEDIKVNPSVEFAYALNAVLSYGRHAYKNFMYELD